MTSAWCEHFSACAWTHEKAKSRKNIRQAPSTLLIAHLQKIASPPALLYEPSPTLASANNLSILKKLKCALCSNVLSQPLELTCSALVCTKCLTECIAASGAVSCPCCSDNDLSHVRPASSAILLLLSDVRRHCAACNRDIRIGDYEGHECVPSLTPEEEKQAEESHLYQFRQRYCLTSLGAFFRLL